MCTFLNGLQVMVGTGSSLLRTSMGHWSSETSSRILARTLC